MAALIATATQPEPWASAEDGVAVSGFSAFFDAQGAYTAVGAIQNYEPHYVVPRVTAAVLDGNVTVTESLLLAPLAPSGEMPFKIRFSESVTSSAVLLEPRVSYVATWYSAPQVAVLYDDTLVLHEDGHLTGRVINVGDEPANGITILAVIHGNADAVLDVGRSLERIDMEPGEVSEFSMYPDPAVSGEVTYYSCFAVTDSFVRPVYTERNGERFYFRYESGAAYSFPQFDEGGTELRMRASNSFPLETYASFEFPVLADGESFSVYVNDAPKESVQSLDEWGNWHVSFSVEPFESGEILITGFAEGWEVGDRLLIPDWMKNNALKWVDGEAGDDVFLRGIEFMIAEKIVQVEAAPSGDAAVPAWVKSIAALWTNGLVDDRTFVAGVEYLLDVGVIRF